MIADENTTSMRNAAAAYHHSGWCPIPTKDQSKEPNLVKLEPYLSRPATKEELNSWSWPGVGIVTGPVSGILVLDVDGSEGEAVLKEHGHPVTPMVRTGSGGLHLYFKHPNMHVRTGIRVAPGLDVKAAGGYVVAPPSIGPGGKCYEWIVQPDEAEPADVPEWLLQLIEHPRRNGSAQPVGARIPAGQRNKQLTSLAGTMRRRGMGEAEIFAALRVANEQRCEPPLMASEVERIAASVARYAPEADGAKLVVLNSSADGSRPVTGFARSDLGNAERFVAYHGQDVRYCHPWRKWLVWDGTRWVVDAKGLVRQKMRQTVRSIYEEAADCPDEDERKALAKWALASESKPKIDAALSLAEAEEGIPVSPDELDANAWKLNCLNGTIDLRTGKLLPHDRADLITKLAPVEYAADAEAPSWMTSLEIVQPKQDVRGFLKRAYGYSATGDTSEQVLFINHGPGMNGKSTSQEVIMSALGDYAQRAPTEMLMSKRPGGVPNDVARLKGARFAAASETEEGRRLDESLVKDLTGSDTVVARHMRAEFFEFRPTHKLWLSTNHKPEIRGTDLAMWRRIRLIPWDVTIAPSDQKKDLPKKLTAELPGVLAWIVQGCLEWQEQGLNAPEEVQKATKAYRAESDVLGGFLADCCKIGENESEYAAALWGAWQRWCEESGEVTGTQKKFGGRLAERGFLNHRDTKTGRKVWWGLSLWNDWETRAGIRPNHSTSRLAGNSEDTEPSEPKTNINTRETEPRVLIDKKGSDGSDGSTVEDTHEPRRLSEEEACQVQKLISEGTSPAFARAAMLGEDA